MAQDVRRSVDGTNFEIAMIGREPTVDHFGNLEHAAVERQVAGRLFSQVVSVAFNVDIHLSCNP